MSSVNGPFLGNLLPLIFAWSCYQRGYTLKTGWAIGQDFLSQAIFWTVSILYMFYDFTSILFEVVYIPAVNKWFVAEKARIGNEEQLAQIAS